ncbi:hypothetical protein ATO49_00020 [Mycolicibacterium fortuitum subsp. fortuitum DSM 46621 = ATCC 6841 = JCM 6387]|nr:hypothetical protein ATO49_00020 [Mycolicibacterium fortuitum subsp. fortuitum DSM 46621 = ATCC 6841 = JCM 6387]
MELLDQCDTSGDQRSAVRGEVPVPHIERVEHAPIAPIARSRSSFQQSGALTYYFFVVGTDTCNGRPAGGCQLVEIAAPLTWIAANQRQVLRAEQHRPQHPEDLAGRPHRRPVQPRLVGATAGDLEIDRQLPTFVHHDARDDGALCTGPDQRRVRGHPMRTKRGAIPQCLNKIRLSETVRSDENGPAGLQLELDCAQDR